MIAVFLHPPDPAIGGVSVGVPGAGLVYLDLPLEVPGPQDVGGEQEKPRDHEEAPCHGAHDDEGLGVGVLPVVGGGPPEALGAVQEQPELFVKLQPKLVENLVIFRGYLKLVLGFELVIGINKVSFKRCKVTFCSEIYILSDSVWPPCPVKLGLKYSFNALKIIPDLKSGVVKTKSDIVNACHNHNLNVGIGLMGSVVSDLKTDVKVYLLLWIRIVRGTFYQLHCEIFCLIQGERRICTID